MYRSSVRDSSDGCTRSALPRTPRPGWRPFSTPTNRRRTPWPHATVRYVREAGVLARIGFNRRFDRQYTALKRAVGEGEVGRVEMMHLTSRSHARPTLDYVKKSGRPGWRPRRRRLGQLDQRDPLVLDQVPGEPAAGVSLRKNMVGNQVGVKPSEPAEIETLGAAGEATYRDTRLRRRVPRSPSPAAPPRRLFAGRRKPPIPAPNPAHRSFSARTPISARNCDGRFG